MFARGGAATLSTTDSVACFTILTESSDGAAVSDETRLSIRGKEPSEIMLFDLP